VTCVFGKRGEEITEKTWMCVHRNSILLLNQTILTKGRETGFFDGIGAVEVACALCAHRISIFLL